MAADAGEDTLYRINEILYEAMEEQISYEDAIKKITRAVEVNVLEELASFVEEDWHPEKAAFARPHIVNMIRQKARESHAAKT